eukprot:g2955.t1
MHAYARDSQGEKWRVRIVDIDPATGAYDCTVLDGPRTRLALFEGDLEGEAGCESWGERFLLAGFGYAQEALGLASWAAALLQDLPRKWASDQLAMK